MSVHFNCQYSYGDGFSLDASFETGAGVTGICGHSGSGKTTMLMLLAGLLRPRVGVIKVSDETLVDTARNISVPPERRSIGMVFQDNLLLPHYNVRTNLTYGQKRKPIHTVAFDEVIDVLELAPLLERRPATLSGGQARRVAIGRALLRGPKLLVFDEPWVGLEHELRDRVVTLVNRCVDTWQIPMLIVSHERQHLQAMTQQTIEMAHGSVQPSADQSTATSAAINQPTA